MKKLFGTDGIRGHAGEFPLDEKTVQIIGRSIAAGFEEKLGRPARFITGRDTRESGESIERAFQAGARNAFCESSGIITTPGVAFLTGAFNFDAGIVISASHNPFQDNGIKIFLSDGKKMAEEMERFIEQEIYSATDFDKEDFVSSGSISRSEEFCRAYLDHFAKQFAGLDLSNVKIVADCANGAASHLAPQLFESFGANVVAINDKPNGRNINESCGSLHLGHLQAKVIEENADFGVAFDGDADRALFVDEKGNVVDGDATLWVMAKYFQDHGRLENKTVVATVMSNIGLEIALASRNLKLVRTDVGDKYVLDELIRSGSEIGGEQSGHIIFPKRSLVGDGMMTALYLLRAIVESCSSFSVNTSGFMRYPQILVNTKVREKRPFEDVPEIAAASKQIQDDLAGNGRLLLRYSGTENLARVMIEGKDQAAIEKQANDLAKIIGISLG